MGEAYSDGRGSGPVEEGRAMEFWKKAQILGGVARRFRELDDDFFRDLEKRLEDVDRKKVNSPPPPPAPPS